MNSKTFCYYYIW